MVLKLIKRLFSSSKPTKPSATTVPEQMPATVPPQVELVAVIPEHKPNSAETLSLATSFSDFLLGVHSQDNQPPNQAERFIINGLEGMLRGSIPESAVPRLPDVAMALLKELANPNVSQDAIMAHITRDPALASEVLHMSNSALFRVMSGPQIVNLEKALIVLGLDNLKAIVSSALMKQLMAIAPIYFRMFGQHLWQHSLDCAHSCRTLAKLYGRADPHNAYLVGLMHDTGKLAIFNLLTQSLAQNIDIQPRGSVFSHIVRDHSQKLSAKIAREWLLPEYLLTALDEQIAVKPASVSSVYGSILNQANILAEFKAVAEKAVRTNENFEGLLEKYSISLPLFKEVFPQATEALMVGN